MKAHLQFIERQSPVDRNDQFAIEDELFRGQLLERGNHVREVTRERFAGFRLEENFIAFPKGETAKAIPFRFVLPLCALGNFIHGTRFHRRQRRL